MQHLLRKRNGLETGLLLIHWKLFYITLGAVTSKEAHKRIVPETHLFNLFGIHIYIYT